MLRQDVIPDVGFKHLLRHRPVSLAGIQIFLFEIEAVAAIEVADRPRRLGHHVESRQSFARRFRTISGVGPENFIHTSSVYSMRDGPATKAGPKLFPHPADELVEGLWAAVGTHELIRPARKNVRPPSSLTGPGGEWNSAAI